MGDAGGVGVRDGDADGGWDEHGGGDGDGVRDEGGLGDGDGVREDGMAEEMAMGWGMEMG